MSIAGVAGLRAVFRGPTALVIAADEGVRSPPDFPALLVAEGPPGAPAPSRCLLAAGAGAGAALSGATGFVRDTPTRLTASHTPAGVGRFSGSVPAHRAGGETSGLIRFSTEPIAMPWLPRRQGRDPPGSHEVVAAAG